ncbi:ABC-2 type transport system permease protein [Tamaricihabitans halophyticus]|uniref:ABC-2 type transport system permease protein n=1 Tax=Tamaricihabitans halophyticus TaxID=1262583 RepID=A0A4R2QWD7_9PSEU|nr:ABC transporter permease [Tamaricihabitans halophyticus]TCP54017.1 ABC-2 type transport system permease protein [Tamaricihabitans halophyticus]
MIAAVQSIMRAELKLLARNTTVALTATLLPLAFAGVMLAMDQGAAHPIGWAYPIAMQLLVVFGASTYLTSTAALCHRREELYLKRLRSGPASDVTVLVGVLSPVVVLSLLQAGLVLLITGTFAPAAPTNPLLLVLVVLLGTVMCLSLGMATSGYAATGEQAQIVTMPFFLLLVGSAVWASLDIATGLSQLQMVLPGGAVTELTRLAYGDGSFTAQLTEALPPIGVLVAWTIMGVAVATKAFRWEPRG